MFGIDLPEFLLIIFVAVVVIGPKDLPRALYLAGKLVRKIKSYTTDIQKTLDKIMEEGELEEIIREANKPGGDDLQQKIEHQMEIEQKSDVKTEDVKKEDAPAPEAQSEDKAESKDKKNGTDD